jgi:putative nucleotidyltransferase with HDIG domain
MAARVFALASSSAYHGRGRPSTLEQCLSLLGMNAIKTVVINESVMQVFNRFTSGRDVDLKRFWGHSLRTALIARELARRGSDDASPEEAYLGGLLHDVGQLAILASDPETYTRIFYEYEDNQALCARETEVFALTHAEVGAWLVEKWELDSFLGDSVLYHHESTARVAAAPPRMRRPTFVPPAEAVAEELIAYVTLELVGTPVTMKTLLWSASSAATPPLTPLTSK